MSKHDHLVRLALSERAEHELTAALTHLRAAATVLETVDPSLLEASNCAIAQTEDLQRRVLEVS